MLKCIECLESKDLPTVGAVEFHHGLSNVYVLSCCCYPKFCDPSYTVVIENHFYRLFHGKGEPISNLYKDCQEYKNWRCLWILKC